MGERTEIPFVMTQNDRTIDIKESDKTYAYLEQTIGKVEKYDHDTKELLYTIEPARTFYIGKLADVDKDYQEQLNFKFKYHKNQ